MARSNAGLSLLRRPDAGYSQVLSFLTHWPQMGLISSHFRCRLRQVMLRPSTILSHVPLVRHGSLTIHSWSVTRGRETCACVAADRVIEKPCWKFHNSMHHEVHLDHKLDSFWLMSRCLSPSRGHIRNVDPFHPHSLPIARDPPHYPASYGIDKTFTVYSSVLL